LSNKKVSGAGQEPRLPPSKTKSKTGKLLRGLGYATEVTGDRTKEKKDTTGERVTAKKQQDTIAGEYKKAKLPNRSDENCTPPGMVSRKVGRDCPPSVDSSTKSKKFRTRLTQEARGGRAQKT